MILAIECVILCMLFTLAVLPAQYKDPINMTMSYPPEIRKRVESLPQYKDNIKKRERSHIVTKVVGLFVIAIILAVVAWFSGAKEFRSAFHHVLVLFLSVNIYDLLILDWGIFCHSRKLRISGTEDMDKAYKDYLFHVKGAAKGIAVGIVAAGLSASIVWVMVMLI